MVSDDTVFVHVFAPDGRQALGADGDAWGGMLPCAAWPASGVVEDIRELDTGVLPPGIYRVTVGVYRRATNTRYPARSGADGIRFADDEVAVGTITGP